ncbi:MAG: hypothetical protein F4X54_04070 [Chloroflexi bacterium]|nr:hypothetical protein [Chloroflexota bacterium]
MRIERLDVYSFPVPFKAVFRHASASRSRAENLIVAARSDDGLTGYGEGCPRDYVTGETAEGGAAFIRRHAQAIADAVTDGASLRAWADAHREEIDEHPAAFCAIELAVLDLLGKAAEAPVEDIVGVPRLDGSFTYSAVLGDSPYLVYRLQHFRYRRKGFTDFKVKVSGDLGRDRRKLRVFGNKQLRVRLDANNLWADADECIEHLNALGGGVFAVEEPLTAGDLAGFERVSEECGVRIILDESLLRASQLDGFGSPERWIVNVRVSKMGGIGRSLEVVERAASLGMGVIVGAQVGETSILTRAGLTGMQAARPVLAASEGAFGTHLLREDLTMESLMFGDGGVLTIPDANAPGLGLVVREGMLVPV